MQNITVVQEDREIGALEEADDSQLMVRLADGRHARVSRDDLVPLRDGTLMLATPLEKLRFLPEHEQPSVQTMNAVPVVDGELGVTTVPRVEEQLHVDKVEKTIGSVRVRIVPSERQQTVSVPVTETHADVRRVAIGRIVDGPPAVREEGDVVIVPVLEEVLVVEKKLLLREEIHITRRETTRTEEHQVSLRSERAEISHAKS
jgi:stress response protein YsnF